MVFILLSYFLCDSTSKNWFNRFLNWKPFYITGKLSYGLYLYHLTASGIVMVPILLFLEQKGLERSIELFWIGTLISVFVATVIGYLSYYFVEKPFLLIRELKYKKISIQNNSQYEILEDHSKELININKIPVYLLNFYTFFPFWIVFYFKKYLPFDKNSIHLYLLLSLILLFYLHFIHYKKYKMSFATRVYFGQNSMIR
jgi:hypothetical protein